MNCRHYPQYPHCTCDSVSCVMLRSTANPAGLESLAPSLFGDPMVRDELRTLRAENERLAAACRDARALATDHAIELSKAVLKLNEVQAARHPWYGPCDALGPNGECAECAKGLAVNGHGAPCVLCDRPCSSLEGDPGLWPIRLGNDGWRHIGCVNERLASHGQPIADAHVRNGSLTVALQEAWIKIENLELQRDKAREVVSELATKLADAMAAARHAL